MIVEPKASGRKRLNEDAMEAIRLSLGFLSLRVSEGEEF
jgi:hypothetical protein